MPIAATARIPYPRRVILRNLLIPVFCPIALTFGATTFAAQTIVIDPGHGGSDLGTVHRTQKEFITEKQVTLLIAREIETILKSRGYQVFLTRKKDQNLSLPARTQFANRLKADLFISIHMNSMHGGVTERTQGVETYILNNTSDASSRRLAALENTDNRITNPQEVQADSPADLALILKDLRLDANLGESKRLACHLQSQVLFASQDIINTSRAAPIRPGSLRQVGYSTQPQLKSKYSQLISRNRGVKQALFHVLLGADMPSALLEVGFLAHPTDRTIVLTPRYRRQIAQGIYRAVDQYFATKGRPETIQEQARCLVH